MSTTFNENNSIAALHQLLRDKGFEEGVLDEFDRSFVLTDPSLEDNPLVWVSQEFLTVTGYQREEVIGRNCRFLQGPDTQAKDVRQIRQFIDSQEPGSVRILNYTKSGTPFINEFAVVPLQLDGKTLLFLGAQSMLTFGPPSDSPHSVSFSPRQSESTSSPSSPSFLSPSSSVSSSSSDSMSSEPPSFDSSTSDTSISEASTSDSSSADSSSADSSSSDSSSSDSSSSDSSLSSAGIEQINPETVEVEAGPSSVLVTSSGRTTRPNGRFIPFESEFCQGRVLLKTRGTPAANPNVAGYFSGRNRLFELQVQFTMKQDVPLDHDIIIGGEVRRPMDLGWGSKFVASSILGILKLFNVSLHHSFGDRQQYAHLCFPFSVLPDSLIVTPSDQRPPSLTYGDLVGPSVLGRVGPDFRPTTGNVYTLSFYSQYIDFENWSVVRLPGVSSVSLKTFWSECPLNIVAYAVPRSAPIHAITQRLDLFELEIAHLSLLNLDRQINF